MDAAKANEQVLVIPESQFHAAGAFTGFRTFDDQYLATLLDPRFLSYRPRGEVETDPLFKQLIPYVVLQCRGDVFHYTRGRSGTEARLRALRSVGIGGHISREDGSAADAYRNGMLRELVEEVTIEGLYRERCLGFIYDPSTPVGEVHLGIAHVFDLEQQLVQPREDAIAEAGFAPLVDLLGIQDQFETWSQLTLMELYAANR